MSRQGGNVDVGTRRRTPSSEVRGRPNQARHRQFSEWLIRVGFPAVSPIAGRAGNSLVWPVSRAKIVLAVYLNAAAAAWNNACRLPDMYGGFLSHDLGTAAPRRGRSPAAGP